MTKMYSKEKKIARSISLNMSETQIKYYWKWTDKDVHGMNGFTEVLKI